MRFLKKILILIFILIFSSIQLISTNLIDLIKSKNYSAIRENFEDSSYKPLLKILRENKLLSIKKRSDTSFLISLLKNDRGKIIYFTFKKGKNNKLKELTSIELINPFFIIKVSRIYRVTKKRIKIGDAEILISKANLFILSSSPFPVILEGKIKIKNFPSSDEEKKHFIHLFGKPYKIFKVKWCILSAFEYEKDLNKILNKSPILRKKKTINKKVLKIFKNIFGFSAEGTNEIPFLLNERSENLIIFPYKKSKILAFRFNKITYPDTQLFGLNFKKILLDYNKLKSMKLMGAGEFTKISEIKFEILLDKNFKDYYAKEKLYFKHKISKLSISLPNYIKIRSIYTKNNKVSYYKALNKLFIKTQKPMKELELNFSSHFVENDETDFYFSSVKKVDRTYMLTRNPFYFFGRDSNYYLKDNLDFFKFTLKFKKQPGFKCFGGGENTNKNTFYSDSIKGMPLACGKFSLINKLNSKTQLFRIYSDFIPNHSVKKEIYKVTKIISFLNNIFGKLNIRSINILLTQEQNLSGSSYQGLLILKIPKRKKTFYYPSSPVKFTLNLTDVLVHELAHQWWGGIISWASFRDLWFTEGVSQFAVIEYLQKNSSEEFRKAVKIMNKSVKKYYKFGPILYGKRIGNWEENTKAYFSIIYNKSALVFFMLKEIIGENLLFNNLKNLLKKHKFQSITTAVFLNEIAGKNKIAREFLRDWIYKRELPIIHVKTKINGNSININLFQLTSKPLIFPLYIKITFRNKKIIKSVLIREKKEKIVLKFKEKPLTVKIEENYITPIILK